MHLPKLNPDSLSTKIIAWSFIPTIIILTAVAWYTFYAYQKVTSELVVRQDQELLEINIQHIGESISTVFNPVLVPLLFETSITDPNAISERDAILTSAELLNVFDAGVLLIDADGTLLTAHPERPDLANFDWQNDLNFTRAVESVGRGFFSEIQPIGPGGSGVVAMALAVRDNQTNAVGVVVGLLQVAPDGSTTLNRMFQQVNLGEQIFVVDIAGKILYHPDVSIIGTDISARPTVQRALLNEPPTAQTFDDQGNPLAVNYAAVFPNRQEWLLIKEQPLADLMASTRPYTSMLLALLAMGVIIPSIVVSFGLRRILKPVNDLIAATQDIAGGNFGHKIPVESGDELSELAHQFNRMSEELQTSYALLEQRVEERTRQLATLNAISDVVSRSLDLEEVLFGALEEIIISLPFENGAAYQIVDGELQRVTQCNLSEETCAAFDEAQPMDETVTRLQIIQSDTLPEDLCQSLTSAGINLVVKLPLISKGECLGILALGAQAYPNFSPEEQALLRSIAEQVAVAVENARLYANAEEAAVAEERSRLARDLHDAVTQTLFSTSLIAEALPQIYDSNPTEGRRRAEELRQLTRGALAEMRTLLLELRPHALAETRLEDLLRQLADAVIGRARIPVQLSFEGSGRLPAPVQISMYRIAQESLNNIVKHARASTIEISLEHTPVSAHLCIQDDGIGFDPGSVVGDHFGTSIMRERAAAAGAELNIISQPGQGAQIVVNWNQEEFLRLDTIK